MTAWPPGETALENVLPSARVSNFADASAPTRPRDPPPTEPTLETPRSLQHVFILTPSRRSHVGQSSRRLDCEVHHAGRESGGWDEMSQIREEVGRIMERQLDTPGPTSRHGGDMSQSSVLGAKERERGAVILQVARTEIQRRLSAAVRRRVAPEPAPRYDDVFHRGTLGLEREAIRANVLD